MPNRTKPVGRGVDAKDQKKSYAVGYGKPPKSTQFKPGQSGRPQGRPKGSRNFNTLVDKAMRKKIRVTENGKDRKVQKAEAWVEGVVNEAVTGNLKATTVILNEQARAEARAVHEINDSIAFTPEDLLVVEDIKRRARDQVIADMQAADAAANNPDIENPQPEKP